MIGKGGFGMVVKGVHKITRQERAIKIVKKSRLADPEKFFNEFEIMKKLDHPNVIKLYEMFEDKKFYYLVMEYLEGSLGCAKAGSSLPNSRLAPQSS